MITGDYELDQIQQALDEYTVLTLGCVNWVRRTDEEDYVEIE